MLVQLSSEPVKACESGPQIESSTLRPEDLNLVLGGSDYQYL